MKYDISFAHSCMPEAVRVMHHDFHTVFEALEDDLNAGYRVDFRLHAPIADTYILLPACAYDGNRFRAVHRRYPPMFTEDEFGNDVPVTMTEVPRLSPEGDSFMDVTTGDLSAPYVCIYRKSLGGRRIMSTTQQVHGLNLGISLDQKGDELLISLQAPAKRRLVYRWYEGYPSLRENPEADPPLSVKAGQWTQIDHLYEVFPCSSISALYEKLFELRYSRPVKQHNTVLPFSAFWKLSEEKANKLFFIDGENFYRLPSMGEKHWQAGWVGGGMNTLPLLCEGSGLSRERAIQTLEFAARYQSAAGWYYGIVHNSAVKHDCFGMHGDKHSLVMVRKHADLTYFMWKQIYTLRRLGIECPDTVCKSAAMASEALIKLWRTYGQLGQFINAETGEIKVGSSAAGGIVPAALCAAYEVTGNSEYLKTASEIGDFFYNNYISKGMTTGGPGEILSAPDSESCAALLESYIALFEADGSVKWLEYAKETAYQLSSWVVSYEYEFPADSQFGKLGVNSCGSVWANVQNKHSAPGLCTLSPAALFKLYRASGDGRFLTLMYHIANFMPQVVSTSERPVYIAGGDALMPGEMCERVNLSDWEGREGIGDSIFGSSAWPEVSLMLTWLEVPGVYVDSSRDVLCVSDNVNAWLENGRLVIENPTGYDAEVKLMFEKDTEEKLGLWWQDRFDRVQVPAGGRTEVAVK